MSEILFADDDAAMREMVSDILLNAGHRVRLVENGQAALDEVRRSPPDLVLLDQRMPSLNGLQVCRSLKDDPRLEHLPVILVTAQGRTEDRIEGFDAGANDYLPKPFDARELLARVNALLRITRQGLDRNPTSGLAGGEAVRRHFQRRIEEQRPFSVCYFDLDHFKPFGDRFGFSLGDLVIRDAAQVLAAAAAADDFVGHIGGDDFILMCAAERARGVAVAVQEGFRRRLAERLPPEVVQAGGYESVDREGNPRTFPLTRLTAAIVNLAPSAAISLDALGVRVAEAKQEAKRTEDGIVEMTFPADGGEVDRG